MIVGGGIIGLPVRRTAGNRMENRKPPPARSTYPPARLPAGRVPEQQVVKPGQTRAVRVAVASTDGLAHHLAIAAQQVPQTGLRSGAAVTPSIAGVYQVTGNANPYATPLHEAQPSQPSPSPCRVCCSGCLASPRWPGP